MFGKILLAAGAAATPIAAGAAATPIAAGAAYFGQKYRVEEYREDLPPEEDDIPFELCLKREGTSEADEMLEVFEKAADKPNDRSVRTTPLLEKCIAEELSS